MTLFFICFLAFLVYRYFSRRKRRQNREGGLETYKFQRVNEDWDESEFENFNHEMSLFDREDGIDDFRSCKNLLNIKKFVINIIRFFFCFFH